MKTTLTLIIILIFSFTYAQKKDIFQELNNPTDKGNVTIIQDATIGQAIKDYTKAKKEEEGLFGYRIQVYFGTGHSAREKATDIRNKAITQFKNHKPHLIYQAPYFKLRIGDFRKKSDALKIMDDIKAIYPGAFIVKDYIDFPKLKSNED